MMHTPYGYKIENGQAVIDEPVAEKVRQLFVEFLNCGSMRAAAVKVGVEKTHSVIGLTTMREMSILTKSSGTSLAAQRYWNAGDERHRRLDKSTGLWYHIKKIGCQ